MMLLMNLTSLAVVWFGGKMVIGAPHAAWAT